MDVQDPRIAIGHNSDNSGRDKPAELGSGYVCDFVFDLCAIGLQIAGRCDFMFDFVSSKDQVLSFARAPNLSPN